MTGRLRAACLFAVCLSGPAGPVVFAMEPAQPPGASIPAGAPADLTRPASIVASTPQMPPKFLWTGVPLISAGTLAVLAGVLAPDCSAPQFNHRHCRRQRKATYVIGGSVIASGAIVLAIGDSKRDRAPHHGVVIGSRAAFWHVEF
jgi:hypothetical protein